MGAFGAVVTLALVMVTGSLAANCPPDNGRPVPCRLPGLTCYCPSRRQQVTFSCWKHPDGRDYLRYYDLRTGVSYCPKTSAMWQESERCVHPVNKNAKSMANLWKGLTACSALKRFQCVAYPSDHVNCKCGPKTVDLRSYSHDRYIHMYSWSTGEFVCPHEEVEQDTYQGLKAISQQILNESRVSRREQQHFMQKMVSEDKLMRQDHEKLLKEERAAQLKEQELLQKVLKEHQLMRQNEQKIILSIQKPPQKYQIAMLPVIKK